MRNIIKEVVYQPNDKKEVDITGDFDRVEIHISLQAKTIDKKTFLRLAARAGKLLTRMVEYAENNENETLKKNMRKILKDGLWGFAVMDEKDYKELLDDK